MLKNKYFFALALFLASLGASADSKCNPSNLQWFYSAFEPLDIKKESIRSCLDEVMVGTYNLESELAAHGECLAGMITNRENGRQITDTYNELMLQCGEPQLFIAQVSNTHVTPTGDNFCYLHVINNLPSAGISPSCIEKLKLEINAKTPVKP